MQRMSRGFLCMLGWEQDGRFGILGKEAFTSQGPWVAWALFLPLPSLGISFAQALGAS